MQDYINLILERMNEKNVYNPFMNVIAENNPSLPMLDKIIQ